MSHELDHIWSRVQNQLALVVDEATYRIWLEPLRPVELLDDTLVVRAQEHACRWTRERFGSVLNASAELALGVGARIELVASETASTGPPRTQGPQPAARARPLTLPLPT